MMKQNSKRASMLLVAGVLATWTLASPLLAVDIVDDPTQIDERMTQLIQTTNSLCWEMNRFHQQQPDYAETYQAVKDIWTQAGQIQSSLRSGTVETAVLIQQVNDMNNAFANAEKALSQWETGDRSSLITNGSGAPVQRTVVRQGVGVDLPFIGVRVGGPDVVVTEEVPLQIERKRLHPNSHGSKRSLEREVAATRVALNYLVEDAGGGDQPSSQSSNGPSTSAAVPQPPKPDSGLKDSQVVPARTTKPATGTAPK